MFTKRVLRSIASTWFGNLVEFESTRDKELIRGLTDHLAQGNFTENTRLMTYFGLQASISAKHHTSFNWLTSIEALSFMNIIILIALSTILAKPCK